jgi:ELWxxDGT repeat protein
MHKTVTTLFVAIIFISAMTITAGINHVDAVDGNEPTVTLVKDINTNSTYRYGDGLFGFFASKSAPALYLRADDGIRGIELWTSDGTAAGTVMVKDINPCEESGLLEAGDSSSSGFMEVGATLFFVGDDGVHGRELWKSDGTAAGTQIVKDIWEADGGNSDPGGLTKHGSMVYFSADDGLHGRELWRSDGTTAGTVLVKNINTFSYPYDPPGSDASSKPWGFVSQGSYLYFVAFNNTYGEELWRTDGTEAGTFMLKEIVPGSDYPALWSRFKQFKKALGSLVFIVDDGSYGEMLWITDGTTVGTQLLKHFTPGMLGEQIFFLEEVGGYLLFLADDGTHGYELWRTDGTSAGTVMVMDLNPSGDGVDDDCFGNLLAKPIGSYVYFVGDDGTYGFDQTSQTWTPMNIWKSDGTVTGTVKVTNFGSGQDFSVPDYLASAGDTLFFFQNMELWKIDYPDQAPAFVFDLTPPPDIPIMWTAPKIRGPWLVVDDNLFLIRLMPMPNAADLDDIYEELWITDGSTSGTRLLFTTADWREILPPVPTYDDVVVDNVLFFGSCARPVGTTPDLGCELYKYPNEAPNAVLPDSINGLEGSAIAFDASMSTDDGGIASYKWDWNGDGTYEETTNTLLVEHTWYDDYSGSVKLEVVDGYGLVGEATTTVNVLNMPPVASIDSIEHPYSHIFVGDTVTFHGSFLDPGADDTHSITWDFGDGTLASGVLKPTHVYATNGLFTVTLTVVDDDGGVGSNSITIKVVTVNEALSDLIKAVKELNIEAGLKSGLLGKLQDANRLLIKGNYVGAAGKLNDFINQVEAQRGKKLANELATSLISGAQGILDHI